MTVRPHMTGLAGCSLAALALLPTQALAHHAMDGKVPVTLAQGFMTGLAHPVIGIDHLAFVVAVGLIAAILNRVVALPAAFVGGTLGGCLIHLAGVGLPGAEILIAATVVVLGFVVAAGRTAPTGLALGFVAVAGVFHGWAYGEGIFGAEQAPLGAYLVGFLFVQSAIAVGTAMVARTALTSPAGDKALVRVAGAVVLGVGLAILIGHVEAVAFPGIK